MRAALLLLLVTACEREWVRPYEGLLPDDDRPAAVLLVRDHLTGKPVPWALVLQQQEWAMGPDGSWAPIRAEAVTDEFGLAAFHVPKDAPDFHWAVHAKGYAPTETYGTDITEEVELRPPRTSAGRVLGIDGRALAGAVVEWKIGCAHAPTLARATTDATGLFVLDGIDDTGEFVLEGPPGAADYLEAARPPWLVPGNQMLPGRTVRGRVVRADGTPPAWAVVCGAARAPRAVAFTLRGFTGGALWVWWDGGLAEIHEPLAPGIPVVLGVEPRPEPAPVEVRLRVATEESGEPLPPVAVHLDRMADGRRFSFECAEEASAEIPPGTYWLSAGSPWSPWAGERTLIDTRHSCDLQVVVHRKPTLSFDLGLPDEARARCRIVLEEDSIELREDEPAYLPAKSPAWLRVDLGGTAYTVEIAPEHAGVRRAEVRLPGRKFIRVPGLEQGLEWDLLGETAEVVQGPDRQDIQTESNGLATYGVGERWLLLAHPERGWAAVKVDLPFEAKTLEPDCTLAPWPEPSEIRVLCEDGTPVPSASVTLLDPAEPDGCLSAPPEPSETDDAGILRRRWLRDGLHVRIDAGERVPFWTTLRGKPPYEIRIGAAAIVLDLADLDAATGVLDGFVWEAEEETIAFEGLAAGPHTLIVGAKGGRALAYRLVLRDGETRRIKPDLRPR